MIPLTPNQIHTRPPASLVAAVRDRHGLTQAQCAASVGVDPRSWQGYESKDGAMPMQVWWLFLLRAQEIRLKDLPPIPARQRVAASV
jgi:transcriptional regulator with XRE-family HTH domain